MMTLVGLSVWQLAYPERYRCTRIAMAVLAAVVLVMPSGILHACNGSFVAEAKNQKHNVWVIGNVVYRIGIAATFVLWMIMYRGPSLLCRFAQTEHPSANPHNTEFLKKFSCDRFNSWNSERGGLGLFVLHPGVFHTSKGDLCVSPRCVVSCLVGHHEDTCTYF